MDMGTMMMLLGEGFLVTLQIFFLTLVGSLPLGVLVALARMSKFKPLAALTRFYISVMRGTPLMLQMFFVFFAPFYLFGVELGSNYKFWACIIAFIVNYAAYFAEIYRGGIQSMPRGHYEAASVLGYSKAQTFTKIIFPQVVKRILPAMSNEIITLVKDTSLAFAIGVSEMFTVAKAVVAAQKAMTAFVAAGVFYYLFNLCVEIILNRIEKKLNYYHD
ncbi:MAG: amino acid ABC transporter permease [Raoultibacter sp.]